MAKRSPPIPVIEFVDRGQVKANTNEPLRDVYFSEWHENARQLLLYRCGVTLSVAKRIADYFTSFGVIVEGMEEVKEGVKEETSNVSSSLFAHCEDKP